MSRLAKKTSPTGVTLVYPLPEDADAFYQRLILSGLRLAPVPVQASVTQTQGYNVLLARHDACTGYLFATDGIEAPESDLYRFLSEELSERGRLTISGRYVPTPGSIVVAEAHFLMIGGRLLTSERRVMTGSDGDYVILRSRSDLKDDNVISLPPRLDYSGVDL